MAGDDGSVSMQVDNPMSSECLLSVHIIRGEWYNTRCRHEQRKAHVEAERRQDEVFGCIPHGRGAYQDWPRP